MNKCDLCGLPVPPLNEPFSYAGRMCIGHGTYTPRPVTADDVRKIVREELKRLGVGKTEEDSK
jgi:hypothetical protein